MTSVDRLFEYMKNVNISAYNFERTCGIANGYLKKQTKGKGTIGSEILEKIASNYSDLSLTWLVTGQGKMLIERNASLLSTPQLLADPQAIYLTEQTIKTLKERITILENIIIDKEKIIALLEKSINS